MTNDTTNNQAVNIDPNYVFSPQDMPYTVPNWYDVDISSIESLADGTAIVVNFADSHRTVRYQLFSKVGELLDFNVQRVNFLMQLTGLPENTVLMPGTTITDMPNPSIRAKLSEDSYVNDSGQVVETLKWQPWSLSPR